MTTEQKARAYDEALERARAFELPEYKNIMASVFPELAESKDERIRKAILTGLIDCRDAPDLGWSDFGGINIDECITWLEKQGKQTADKVEPKFKFGDWITSIDDEGKVSTQKVVDFWGDKVRLVGLDEYFTLYPKSELNNYHLWSITDAKNGDLIYVSTEEKGIQAIFHEYKNDTIFFHCYLCADFVQGGYMPIGSVELTYPLQKTHYNRFFEKMHEAGYGWDGKKKELKKIESKTLDADKVIHWM